jgi:antitoxin YefM
MSKTLPLSEVKTHLPSIVAGVEEREEEVVVTRNGRPAAVLVSYEEYARLKATLDVLSDPGMLRQIRESRRHFDARRRGVSFEDLFDEPLRTTVRRSTRR